MPTKLNWAGEQQKYNTSNGEYSKGSGEGGTKFDGKPNKESNKQFDVFDKSKSNIDRDARNKRIEQLKNEYLNTPGFFAKAKIKHQIEFLESDFATFEEWEENQRQEQENKQKALDEEYNKKLEEKKLAKQREEEAKKKQLEQDIKEAPEQKRKQFEIIQKNNPMQDEYHVGIRSPKDIKTWEEAINDEESFAWRDFSKQDAVNALKKGKITVYSSYPIKQGVFVSTSKNQAEQYAGGKGKKVYSQEIDLDKVAWINGDEGQFANVEQEKNFENFEKKE